ncbi:hypothetical protein D7X87_08805 [bacterium D16-54]|nr:hypothetical protein D7X87_08805 [bacterium D16-54]RKJ15214.1 hypothetical protein D7X65_08805 [bacterium D16-56]
MLWYLLKTWAGREEELVKVIHKTIPSYQYKECFVIYQERIWRRQQRSIVHRERLFPGCVFLTCEDSGKEDFLPRCPEKNPDIGDRMAWGNITILPMMPKDGEFLEKISGTDHVVRLSYVQKEEGGEIALVSGPLKKCAGQMERIQLKKRYAVVRCRLWGEEQAIVLGIMLREDKGRMFFNAGAGTLDREREMSAAFE